MQNVEMRHVYMGQSAIELQHCNRLMSPLIDALYYNEIEKHRSSSIAHINVCIPGTAIHTIIVSHRIRGAGHKCFV